MADYQECERVAVLMSTYNGGKYIEAQVESIMSQVGVKVTLIIRDDGSTDSTLNIILKLKEKYRGKIIFVANDGENYGSANSFMTLLDYSLRKLDSSFQFFAFADQDDFWLKNKLMVAVEKIRKTEKPGLYFSKKTIVDEYLKEKDEEDEFIYKDSFLQYFTMSNASGCTFLFNRKLAEMCNRKPRDKVIHHDAWIYRVAGCINSYIYMDDDSYILYRQHGDNVVGKIEYWTLNKGLRRLTKKRNHVLQKTFKAIYNQFEGELNDIASMMLPLVCEYDNRLKSKVKLIFWNETRKYGIRVTAMWAAKVIFNGI